MTTRNRVFVLLAAVVAMLAIDALPAAAQEARGEAPRSRAGAIPRRPDGKPDLTGRWNGSAGQIAHTNILEEHAGGFGINAGKSLIIDPANGIIPYQPWALAERNRRREDANGYEDPVGHCEFYDIGRHHPFAWEIMYSGNLIIISPTQHITRVIDMTRREHLPSGIRLWLGDPIGRWDGDTLVIESTNFNAKTRMGIGGDFYSADARLTERYRMVDANTIDWTLLVDDPKVFTRPWTMTSGKQVTRVPLTMDFNDEDTCHEGNVDLVHLKNVYDQARQQ
jgi:hypothetical protein